MKKVTIYKEEIKMIGYIIGLLALIATIAITIYSGIKLVRCLKETKEHSKN